MQPSGGDTGHRVITLHEVCVYFSGHLRVIACSACTGALRSGLTDVSDVHDRCVLLSEI